MNRLQILLSFTLLASTAGSALSANDPAAGMEICKTKLAANSISVDPLNPDLSEPFDSLWTRAKSEVSKSKAADQATYVISERLSRWITTESAELVELETVDPQSAELKLRQEALQEARNLSLAIEKKLAPVMVADVAHWETQEVLLNRAQHATGYLLEATLLKLASVENLLKSSIERLKRDIAQEVYNLTAKENMQQSLAAAETKFALLRREIESHRSRATQSRWRRSLIQP